MHSFTVFGFSLVNALLRPHFHLQLSLVFIFLQIKFDLISFVFGNANCKVNVFWLLSILSLYFLQFFRYSNEQFDYQRFCIVPTIQMKVVGEKKTPHIKLNTIRCWTGESVACSDCGQFNKCSFDWFPSSGFQIFVTVPVFFMYLVWMLCGGCISVYYNNSLWDSLISVRLISSMYDFFL